MGALAERIHTLNVDEVVGNGLTARGLEFLCCVLPEWDVDVQWSEDRYVDLEMIQRAGGDYRGGVLSRNSRGQVNRTLNAYAKIGEVRTELADSADRALELLAELMNLHQATWRARGRAGAFASARFRSFHEKLIERSFDCGAIQLMRITAGDEPIGLVYNLVDSGRVFFYQSGLSYRDDNRYRPGLATHVLAIERCVELGHSAYHFLAGDVTTPRYKLSLSSHSCDLAWVRFSRPGLKTSSIKWLRALKRKWKPGE
jgi:hypothetical protein